MQWGHLPPLRSHHHVLFSSSYRPHWDGNTAITAPRTILDPIPAPQPLAPSVRLLPQCHRADMSPARTAGQTDASRQPLRRRSRVTERRDRLILRLFIGISLGSARAPRPRRAGAWLTGRHCGGFAMQRPPTRPRPCSPHPGASLSPRAPRSLHKTPFKKKKPKPPEMQRGGYSHRIAPSEPSPEPLHGSGVQKSVGTSAPCAPRWGFPGV